MEGSSSIGASRTSTLSCSSLACSLLSHSDGRRRNKDVRPPWRVLLKSTAWACAKRDVRAQGFRECCRADAVLLRNPSGCDYVWKSSLGLGRKIASDAPRDSEEN